VGWLFFTWRRGGLAFADIVLLAGLVAATAFAFARVRVLAAGLLLPYLAWVMFATALTLALWRANAAQFSR
jgi:tryptophan-rich sensory protein